MVSGAAFHISSCFAWVIRSKSLFVTNHSEIGALFPDTILISEHLTTSSLRFRKAICIFLFNSQKRFCTVRVPSLFEEKVSWNMDPPPQCALVSESCYQFSLFWFCSRVAVAEAFGSGGQGAERAIRLRDGKALRGARRILLDVGRERRRQSGTKFHALLCVMSSVTHSFVIVNYSDTYAKLTDCQLITYWAQGAGHNIR